MKLIGAFLGPATLLVVCQFAAMGQMTHQHKHEMGEKLGRVNFTVSCNKAAQQQFNRAVALLHSFWYDEAEKGFIEATKSDPKCGMGYWGIAMSLYHPVWAPPVAAELQKGLAAAQKASAVSARTPRERDYIKAIEIFYRDTDKLDHRTRALAYEKAMEQLHLQYLKDDEAAIFYALSLLGTALPTDKTYANQKKAAEILNQVLLAEPQHPGVAHYLIHSFDYPALAPLSLTAARSSGTVAPSSPHPLHMPSHIFTRLGLWQESIESNIASADAARNHAVKTVGNLGAKDELHAMDYLAYAYLQSAQDSKAKEVFDLTSRINKVDEKIFQVAYALAAIPARYTLERRQWSDAAALKLQPADFPWQKFTYAEAITHFARAIGAARSGDTAGASTDVARLSEIQKGLVEAKENCWATQFWIEGLGAAAWLAQAQGKTDEALELRRAAADLEDTTEKHPVTPGAIVPAPGP